jgi:hypothetical protein
MSRLLGLAIATAVVAMALGAWLVVDGGANAASGAPGRSVAVRVGDSIRVVGAPIGCRVARVTQLEGRIALDCRRIGAPAGTYGTLLTPRKAALVRFETMRTARMLVVASHGGGVRACGVRR